MRYVLEGSVRRLEDKITVNAQLISTETGAHVWADRFDGERSKLGELQVDFVSRLANSLGVELVKAESLRAMRERPNNPNATDLAMQAAALWSSSNYSPLEDVINLYERALALDPQNVTAMTGLGGVLRERVTQLISKDPGADIARAKLINAALALQPDNSSAHSTKGGSSSRSGNGDRRSRKKKRRSRRTATTPTLTLQQASSRCSSATARTASRASKLRFD